VLERRLHDHVLQPDGRFGNRVVHAPGHGLHVEERHGAVRLRVEVDEQRRFAAERQSRGEIDGGGRLADPALLIGDGDDHEGVSDSSAEFRA
jgi:hypothetical protein